MNWFFKKSKPNIELIDALVDVAINFQKQYKENYPDETDERIFNAIFFYRYNDNPNSKLSEEGKQKAMYYFEKDFKIENIIAFCLAVLDIEKGISPDNTIQFKSYADLLEKNLNEKGFEQRKFHIPQVQAMFERQGVGQCENTSDFVIEWFEKFFGIGGKTKPVR